MELNIFCINKKTKKKQQTTTETWTDDRARQPTADDRASDSNTGRGQQAGTLAAQLGIGGNTTAAAVAPPARCTPVISIQWRSFIT